MSIDELLVLHESAIYGAAFYGVIIFAALLERAFPLRPLAHSHRIRWLSNFGLAALNMALMRGVRAAAGITVAVIVAEQNWGLLKLEGAPIMVLAAVGVVALDFTGYLEHRLMHAVPWLWRIHSVHHADLDMDFTTNYRHHPLEALFTGAVYLVVIAVLGVPLAGVVLFEVLLAVVSVVSHANIGLPDRLDRALRWFVVTPGMHWVHHSALRRETDSNYAMLFSWWDRLFGTYVHSPLGGYQGMKLGLDYDRDPKDLALHRALALPFSKPETGIGADLR